MLWILDSEDGEAEDGDGAFEIEFVNRDCRPSQKWVRALGERKKCLAWGMVDTGVIYWDGKASGETGLGEMVESKSSGGCDAFEISLADSSEGVKEAVGFARKGGKFGTWENISCIFIQGPGDSHLRRKRRWSGEGDLGQRHERHQHFW